MTLHILGSSSKGNSYVLQASDGAVLVLDAGLKLDQVKQVIDYKVSDIDGVLISHSHGDHSKHANSFAQYGIPCYMLQETIVSLPTMHRLFRPITANHKFSIGVWNVIPFPVQHDVPCLGFMINHPEMGTLVYLTDTAYSKFKFKNVNNWLVEANYDEAILEEKSFAKPYLASRVIGSHMSIDTCIGLLQANDLSHTSKIILTHLSDSNSNASAFQQRVQQATGKEVIVADAGMSLTLSAMCPF